MSRYYMNYMTCEIHGNVIKQRIEHTDMWTKSAQICHKFLYYDLFFIQREIQFVSNLGY